MEKNKQKTTTNYAHNCCCTGDHALGMQNEHKHTICNEHATMCREKTKAETEKRSLHVNLCTSHATATAAQSLSSTRTPPVHWACPKIPSYLLVALALDAWAAMTAIFAFGTMKSACGSFSQLFTISLHTECTKTSYIF